MHRLIPFELEKIGRKKSFLLSALLLLAVNMFLLWYTTLPSESRPPLSAYRSFGAAISGMTEEEKADYLSKKKETIDGISFVQEVLSFQNMSGEMGEALLKQSLEANPGLFEEYQDLYQSGNYLDFTDDPEQEKALIDKLYGEWQKVSGYGDYLTSVQEKKDTLSSISIFNQQSKPSFSSRNIAKSAADYARLTAENIHFSPSGPITLAMENSWTDLLLLLSVFLFVGNLILEEKAKKLTLITRSTKYGMGPNIFAKLAALLLSCMTLTLLFYGANLAFSGFTMGLPSLSARIQSLSVYTESSLPLCIWEYLAAAICTKGLVFFGIGALLTGFCILADKALLPYLIGFLVWGVSLCLYQFIPAGSPAVLLKYCNLEGFLKTGFFYGGYLNFNLFGFPVSSRILAWAGILLLTTGGTIFCWLAFFHSQSLELKKLRICLPAWASQKSSRKDAKQNSSKKATGQVSRKACGSLFQHECYKILIAGGALPVLLLFAALLGGRALGRSYHPSASEEYYRTVMLQLEGPCTEEKSSLILSEQAKYEEAFANIEQIEQMVSDGRLSQSAGETLKTKWYTVTAFYPAFLRIWNQYQNICENGGPFIYDTGYLYLFGQMDDGFLIDFLLILLGLIFSFGNAVSMEYQIGALQLISATKKGQRKVFIHKILLCTLFASLLALLTFVCRGICISSVYPLRQPGCPIKNIPYFQDFPLKLSVGVFAALFLLLQMISSILAGFVVLLLGRLRKNHAQTIFFALLLLIVPLLLKLLGFDFAGWFSLYPLYGWN